jgi:predicted nucleic acid-binding protein
LSVYADSSFVVSLYVPDTNSERAATIAGRLTGPVLISSIVILEVTNALELRVFRGQASRSNVVKAIRDLDSDTKQGVYRLLPLPASAWDTACSLSRKHSAAIGTRSLDILQVAAALVLKANAFLTFDRVQANLARAERLATPLED